MDRTRMITAFEKLSEILDDELERQETLFSLLQAQRQGAIARDVPFMQAKTEAIERLMAETADAEKDRHAVLRELVELTGLPPEKQTLTALIACAPSKWAVRLSETQARLQQVMQDAKALAQSNRDAIRRAVAIVDSVLDIVDAGAPDRPAYTHTGRGAESGRGTLLLDQRG